MQDPNLIDRMARVVPLRPALRDTVLRPARGPFSEFSHILLLCDGAVHLSLSGQDDGDARPLIGPVAVILPPQAAQVVRLTAGSTGWLLGLAPTLLAEVVGTKPGSVLLHALSARYAVAQVEAVAADRMADTAAQIAAEVLGAGQGAQMAITAHFRLLLIALWRLIRFEEVSAPAAGGSAAEIMQGFRRLVELHFRDRIAVSRYAEMLGISYDRLHAISLRTQTRSPLQLVHQRMLREAAMRLDRSSETVQGISDGLGFGETSQFSHFFKRNTGVSPRSYRTRARSEAGTPPSFADWP